MANVSKIELIERVAEVADVTKKDTTTVVNALVDVITEIVADGGSVTLTGFVKFDSRLRPAQTCRNPKTGEPLDVPAKRVVTVKAGKSLKEAVAAGDVD